MARHKWWVTPFFLGNPIFKGQKDLIFQAHGRSAPWSWPGAEGNIDHPIAVLLIAELGWKSMGSTGSDWFYSPFTREAHRFFPKATYGLTGEPEKREASPEIALRIRCCFLL